jgi:Family of unknown function (DUF6209)
MSQHKQVHTRTQLVFTRDFREFIRGEFWPGVTATIRYDPFRVVPPGDDYRFGDPARPVVAHLRFREGGPVTDVTLVSRIGVPDCIPNRTDQHAPLLEGDVTIPEGAHWVEIWFSYTGGGLIYDSNWGKNFRLRFYRGEIEVLETTVHDVPDEPLDVFVCRVATAAAERVIVRYRIVNAQPAPPAAAVELHRTDQMDEHGHTIWETRGVSVPDEAVLAYDVVYYADGRPFKDDNQGAFFLACHPQKLREAGY